jgi:cytidylate kinase
MRIVTINGESKVCKTTVGDIVAGRIGGQTADAGQFFRGLTVDVFDAMGDERVIAPNPRLDDAIRTVITSGRAFEFRDRGDLYRPAVEGMVTVVSSRPGVQQAGLEWYGRTIETAVATGVGALVLNGRNPNERMHDALVRTAQAVDLSLLVDCDPGEAARRVLAHKARKADLPPPAPDEIAAMRDKITARSDLDRARDEFPFEVPDKVVVYEAGTTDPHYAVERAREAGSAIAPAEIYFDTTELDLNAMTHHAELLADAVMEQAAV